MEALSADGEHFVRVALPDYAGKWLVLFFYPMDFTFVCPTELTAFSEHRETFRAAGAELLSVSTDSVYTHQAWQRNGLGGLGYPMAADQTLRVCADYGVLLEEEGVALRGLFLIDPEQKVRYSVIHDNNIGRNPEEVLRVLAALKTGGLCAAGWKAGEENLRPDMPEREAPVLAGADVGAAMGSGADAAIEHWRTYGDFEMVLLTEENVVYITEGLQGDFSLAQGYEGLAVTVVSR